MQVSRIKLLSCSARVAGTFVAFFPAFAQEVVSVVGGMVHHADGPFLVEGKEVSVVRGGVPSSTKERSWRPKTVRSKSCSFLTGLFG